MKKIAILLAAVLLIGTTQIVLNLQPEAVIVVEALSPQEIHNCEDPARLAECPLPEGVTLPEGATRSGGLPVVGNGELVYLSASEDSGEEVTAYAWSVSAAPDGSSAAPSSTDAVWTTFRPDVLGQYTLDVTITTASGTATASVVLTSAEFVGVGTVGGLTPDVSKGQCAACHTGHEADWAATGHATMFELAIDGVKSSHYNEGCVECHTVGYNHDPEAVNGGFDDVAADLGWAFPDSLQAGNWDDIVTNFPALAHVSNIQCENCHGPGSLHFGDKSKTAISLDEGMCGSCHEEEPYHRRNTMWKESKHAQGATFASRGGSSSCQPCHNGWGYLAREDIDPAANLAIRDVDQNVSCAVCHDPHDATNVYQLRTVADVELENGVVIDWGGNGKACMSCHRERREGGAEVYAATPRSTFRGPHHSVQADMLAGTNYISFGRVLPNSTHKDVLEDACVSCHMYPTPASGEPGRDKIGDHTWNMHTALDDGTEVDHVAACTGCHGELSSFDDLLARADHDGDGEIEAAQAEVEGLLEEVAMLLPPVGEPTVDIRDPLWNEPGSLLQRKAAWNYFYVEADHSHGVHNFQLTVSLLKLTKDVLTYGVLSEGVIMDIADVPNDQGKQLAVAWNRFGGDGPSATPLQDYYVWRRVDDMGKAAGTAYASLEDVPTVSDKADARLEAMSVTMDGHLWTVVGHQPAASMEMYSAVVPTLFDSTAHGMSWSVFMVSGHASDSQIYVVSDPDSAYSIDNLVPAAPTGLLVTRQEGDLVLRWDDPRDEDFDFFAVYRSTTQGFDPSPLDPLATVPGTEFTDHARDVGKTYYYRLAAFDFSGNRSPFSKEVVISVTTDVASMPGIPTEYALHQNYPNPFNPSTAITFAVPEAGTVRIAVYDIAGKLVDVLVDRHMAPGNYQVTWEAEHFASGVYFYRMETRTFVKAQSMLVLK